MRMHAMNPLLLMQPIDETVPNSTDTQMKVNTDGTTTTQQVLIYGLCFFLDFNFNYFLVILFHTLTDILLVYRSMNVSDNGHIKIFRFRSSIISTKTTNYFRSIGNSFIIKRSQTKTILGY